MRKIAIVTSTDATRGIAGLTFCDGTRATLHSASYHSKRPARLPRVGDYVRVHGELTDQGVQAHAGYQVDALDFAIQEILHPGTTLAEYEVVMPGFAERLTRWVREEITHQESMWPNDSVWPVLAAINAIREDFRKVFARLGLKPQG